VLCIGCAPLPGTSIDGWERAPLELAPPEHAPEHPPATLAFGPPDVPLVRTGNTTTALWLRTSVTVPDVRDPVVLVPRAYVAFAAYVDGTQVAALDDYHRAVGVPFHVIPLPPTPGARVTVVLRIYSSYTQVGLGEPARIGDRSTLLAGLVRRDMPRLSLGLVLLALGALALLFALQPRERRSLLAIALFSLVGGWSLFQTRARQLWLPDLFVWFSIWWLVPPLVSMGAAMFIDSVFAPTKRRPFLWLARFFALYAAVSAVWLLSVRPFGLEAFATPMWLLGRLSFVLGMLFALVVIGRRALSGDIDARFFVGAFLFATICVVHDVLVSTGTLHDGLLVADAGYLAVEGSWIAIVARRLRHMGEQLTERTHRLDRFVRERDDLVRDLHDGLGGVITNVRIVAERARDEGEAKGALASISSLAAEGLLELRLLMTGFDALPESYKALGAELRRSGVTALEGHDIEHHFRAEIDPAMAPPELARFVALSRVHREAITNVIKHAGASRVDVEFVVDAHAVQLIVRDDGRGLPSSEPASPALPGTRRGLASMRARARALNAHLEMRAVEPNGTEIVLRIPLAAR
jgi:signal transduction histidine kinase